MVMHTFRSKRIISSVYPDEVKGYQYRALQVIYKKMATFMLDIKPVITVFSLYDGHPQSTFCHKTTITTTKQILPTKTTFGKI